MTDQEVRGLVEELQDHVGSRHDEASVILSCRYVRSIRAALEKLAEENGRLSTEIVQVCQAGAESERQLHEATSRLAAAEEALERISDMCPDTQEFTVAHSMAAEADAALAKQGGKDE